MLSAARFRSSQRQQEKNKDENWRGALKHHLFHTAVLLLQSGWGTEQNACLPLLQAPVALHGTKQVSKPPQTLLYKQRD